MDVPQGIEEIGLAAAALDRRAGTGLVFRSCSGREGAHLTAWRNGARVWPEYFYLPYDIEPTCTPEQTHP